jgi:chorismate mutase/prephenate dehydratase
MAEQFQHELEALRREMDAIDVRLVKLLNERARVSLRVGALKQQADAAPVLRPEREAMVVAQALAANSGTLRPDHLRAIYREVLAASRDLQRRPRIAFLGPPATFSNQAALEFFGSANDYLSYSTFPEIFTAVQGGTADCGVVPVENSIEGPVQQNLDLLAESDLQVCGEITIPIAHFLMAAPGLGLAEIRRVYAHPQTDGQCRRWLASNLPGRDVTHTTSNIRSAELAAAEPGAAAISPRSAAESHGLCILAENIQDSSSNFTRFFVIARQASEQPTGHDRTAICFSIRDRVGALRDVVEVFATAGLNLSRIQSRPSKRRAWEYLFFVEVDSHPADPRLESALRDVERHCVFLKLLGAWPVTGVGDREAVFADGDER